MKALKLTLLFCFLITLSFGQWVNKREVQNGYKRKFSYTPWYNQMRLKLIQVHFSDGYSEQLLFEGFNFCDEMIYIDFVLVVNGVHKASKLKLRKYRETEYFSGDYYWVRSFWSDYDDDDAKNATRCYFYINNKDCKSQYYEFSFINFTSSLDFMSRK